MGLQVMFSQLRKLWIPLTGILVLDILAFFVFWFSEKSKWISDASLIYRQRAPIDYYYGYAAGCISFGERAKN
jgi:hypothetical protein